MKNYFSLLWKKNINNFQDILQHRNYVDLNHSAIHCRCFLTSPDLQEILLDVETCTVQIPNPSHCETGEQNTHLRAAHLHCIPTQLSNSNNFNSTIWDREELWQRDHFFIQDLKPFFHNLVPAIWVSQHSWSLPTLPKAKPVPVANTAGWSRVLSEVAAHLSLPGSQNIPHCPGMMLLKTS